MGTLLIMGVLIPRKEVGRAERTSHELIPSTVLRAISCRITLLPFTGSQIENKEGGILGPNFNALILFGLISRVLHWPESEKLE